MDRFKEILEGMVGDTMEDCKLISTLARCSDDEEFVEQLLIGHIEALDTMEEVLPWDALLSHLPSRSTEIVHK